MFRHDNFFTCIEEGDFEQFKNLCSKNRNIFYNKREVRDISGEIYTPLMFAVKMGRMEFVKFIIKKVSPKEKVPRRIYNEIKMIGNDIENYPLKPEEKIQNPEIRTKNVGALYEACISGNLEMVKFLVNFDNDNLFFYEATLSQVAVLGYCDIAEFLVPYVKRYKHLMIISVHNAIKYKNIDIIKILLPHMIFSEEDHYFLIYEHALISGKEIFSLFEHLITDEDMRNLFNTAVCTGCPDLCWEIIQKINLTPGYQDTTCFNDAVCVIGKYKLGENFLISLIDMLLAANDIRKSEYVNFEDDYGQTFYEMMLFWKYYKSVRIFCDYINPNRIFIFIGKECTMKTFFNTTFNFGLHRSHLEPDYNNEDYIFLKNFFENK